MSAIISGSKTFPCISLINLFVFHRQNVAPKGCPKIEDVFEYYQKNAPKKFPKIVAKVESDDSDSDSEGEPAAPVKNGKATNGKAAAVANGNGKKKDSSDDSDDSSEDDTPAVKTPAKPVPAKAAPAKKAPAKKVESSDDDSSEEDEAPKKPQVRKTAFHQL